jgi:hypothetical protein
MQRVGFLALIRRFICPIQPAKGIAQVASRESSKLNQHACLIMLVPIRGSFSSCWRTAAVTDSNLKAREFAVFMPRVRGTRANILSVRYRAVNPKNARVFTRGQFPASPANAAAHAFICSEMAGSFGRRFLSFKDAWP